MKKFAMMLLSLSFFGATAMAFEGALVPTLDGGARIHATKGVCPDKPVQNGNYCTPKGASCGVGYDQFSKICWGGWKKGFVKCGVTCKPTEQCGWNHTGDYRCDHRNEDGNGTKTIASVSGALKLMSNGDVQVLAAKNICEDQGPSAGDNEQWTVCRPADGVNCAAGYKRMHKYCWGGFKKGLYRCGYVCEKSRNANDDGNGGGIN